MVGVPPDNVFGVARRRRYRQQPPINRTRRSTAPTIAIPIIAPVESADLCGIGVGVVVVVLAGVGVGIARVGVRAATVARSEKYTPTSNYYWYGTNLCRIISPAPHNLAMNAGETYLDLDCYTRQVVQSRLRLLGHYIESATRASKRHT